ncbi:MAG: hypothetical protein Q7R49_06605 [Candidatus Daviesbacteria bacterium]|nr:hypothetical protein [Candidatus Daviesbacteria bacterium]
MQKPFYDPAKSYQENDEQGPFGGFANKELLENNSEPQYDFLGFKINFPFGIPSGPLLNSKFCKGAFEKGFDVIHYKTRRSDEFPCNSHPNVLFVSTNGDLTLEKAKTPLIGKTENPGDPTEFSITNSFGNPSQKADIWQEDMKKALEAEGKGQLLIASVVGTIREGYTPDDYYDDFALAAKLAKETGVKVIELNLSCPNVASEGVLCYSKEAVEAVCKKSRAAVGKDIKLLAKFGYFAPYQQELLEDTIVRIDPYIDGISAINTIPAQVVNEKGEQALPGPGRLVAGVCGAGIKWAGLDMVKRLDRIRKNMNSDFAIIGVGGVMSPKDYFDYRTAGADVVQSATGSMWNPYLAQEIKEKEIQKEKLLEQITTAPQVG